MAQPDAGDLHVNAILTNVSIGWQPGGYFADKIFPMVPVDKQTDIYAKYNKSYWARDLGAPGAAPTGGAQQATRAPATRATTVGYTVDTTNTYRCLNYALGIEIADELRGNANAVFQLDRDATVLLTSLLKLRFDRMFAADFLATGKWGTDQTISTKWSSYAASTPIEDLRTALFTIRQKTLGMSAEGGVKLLLGALTERRLMDHPDMIDRVKYSASQGSPAIGGVQALAQILGIDEVIVAKSVYTDSEEGGTTEANATYTDVASDDALILWTPRSASQLAPSAGYLFNWRPLSGGGLFFTRKGRQERERYDWVEVHAYLDWVATETGSGVFMDDAVD